MVPRERSPNRDKAFEIYKKHGGNIENRRIAELLQISEKTVGGWKYKDSWEDKLNGVLQSKERSTPKKKGGQPDNKNAVGNRGGAAPQHNKNAVTTGEFETLLFDALEEDEKKLAKAVPPDKEKLSLQEIQLLTVRERRMLKRIEKLKEMDFTVVKQKKGTEKDKWTELNESHAVLGQIQAIEEALTRIQAQKQRAIDSLHRYEYDDAKLALELAKIEQAALRFEGQATEQEDDGFLDALNDGTNTLWSDTDGY